MTASTTVMAQYRNLRHRHAARLTTGVLSLLAAVCGGAVAESQDHQHAGAQPRPATDSAAPVRAAARPQLGLSAAFAPDGTLWTVSTRTVARDAWPAAGESGGRRTGTRSLDQIVVRTSRDFGAHWSAPRDLLASPEPVSADGENRPKLVFGPGGTAVITWTTPTSAMFTGDIRIIRSRDGGASWSSPGVVHADRQRITHRFDSAAFDGAGRLYVAWIDKRDLQAAGPERYRGAALYYAVSEDAGAHFAGDFRVADHSCECCRVAMATDAGGQVLAFWRHVFEPNERDFAIARLDPGGHTSHQRATFERWRIDACPHHGGALAVDASGTQHRVWFNVVGEEGRVYYGRAVPGAETAIRPLPAGAAHADVVATAGRVVIAWTVTDTHGTHIDAWASTDAGRAFTPRSIARTDGASDQPRLIAHGARIFVVWNTETEGARVIEVLP